MKARVTVELSFDKRFTKQWCDENGEEYTDLSEAVVDHFENHLFYEINCADKYDIPYTARIVVPRWRKR